MVVVFYDIYVIHELPSVTVDGEQLKDSECFFLRFGAYYFCLALGQHQVPRVIAKQGHDLPP